MVTLNILTNLAVDTTYAITKYINKFIVFPILDEQERGIPFLFMVADKENASTISFCLKI